jgi:hypothetical protein
MIRAHAGADDHTFSSLRSCGRSGGGGARYHLPMREDLEEHYAGFTIKVTLTKHRTSDRWTGDFTLVQDGAEEISYGPYYGTTIFATCEEAKRATLARARAEIDHQIPS